MFHDDFEVGEIGAAWDEVYRRKNREAAEECEPVQAETDRAINRGKHSARAQLRKNGYEGLTFVKWLEPGLDELYMRHYVRLRE